VSKTIAHAKPAMTGHLRRAQGRIARAFEGEKTEDVMIQAAIGAFGLSLGLRLLRAPLLGDFMIRWAPMLAFAAVCQRGFKKSR
jgi:hypothetical protein